MLALLSVLFFLTREKTLSESALLWGTAKSPIMMPASLQYFRLPSSSLILATRPHSLSILSVRSHPASLSTWLEKGRDKKKRLTNIIFKFFPYGSRKNEVECRTNNLDFKKAGMKGTNTENGKQIDD